MSQCGSPCTEPADCPPSSIQSIGYTSPACCVADTSTTRLCSKYTTTFTAVDCHFTGVVSALADTASTANYSGSGSCPGSFSSSDTPTPCSDTGPSADLSLGQSSSATACSTASASPVSSSHYAHFSVSPTQIYAVTASRVTNVVKTFYDNCACEDAGSASGLGGGYATVNTIGGIGTDCAELDGYVMMEHDSSAGSQITHLNAARRLDCGGCDPCRPGPSTPTSAEIARKTLVERNAKGEIINTHTDTFFLVEYDDSTGYMQNTLDSYENQGRSGSRLIALDPRTASFDIVVSQQTSGAPVTWNTWIAVTESVGSIWTDADYRLEADLNMDGLINDLDARLVLQHENALDIDGNGSTDAKDASAMLSMLASGEIAGDLNFDGRLDVADFLEWKNAYLASAMASR